MILYRLCETFSCMIFREAFVFNAGMIYIDVVASAIFLRPHYNGYLNEALPFKMMPCFGLNKKAIIKENPITVAIAPAIEPLIATARK